MRILLTGGGTAGHVNPALALAETFRQHDPDAGILFAASAQPNDKAGDLVPKAGYELAGLHIRGLRRPVYHPANLGLPFLMLRSRREAAALIKEFKPDLIIGTGGYACWPVVAEGARRGVPTAVHESNAQPGKAIIKVKNSVDRIFINFPDTARRLGMEGNDKVIRVGNPHMPGFAAADRADARRRLGIADDELCVLAFGGSLGAQHVNTALAALEREIADKHPKVTVFHGTGKGDYERVTQLLRETGVDACPRIRVTDYIYDMPLRMAAADLVISRAGAMTISELALLGKAAILVPSPYVPDDHQLKNARSLAENGAARYVEEKYLADGALTEAVLALLADADARRALGESIRERFACPDANEVMYREMMKLCQR